MTSFIFRTIRIVGPDSEAPALHRFRVSSGTCTFDCTNDGKRYEAEARVPRHPWSCLTGPESKPIASPDLTFDPATTLWIVSLPPHLLHPLGRFKELLGQDGVGTVLNDPTQRLAIAALVEHTTTSYCTARTGLKIQGVAVRDRGQITTTIDPQKQARIGIHLDSWDRLPISQRGAARNRLNVNLGAGNRHLLFAARSVMEMAEDLDANECLNQHPTGLVREWLRINPDEPIYDLTIRPGEAYIAPTEVLPHDSSTEGKTHVDVSLTLLGHFNGGAVESRLGTAFTRRVGQ